MAVHLTIQIQKLAVYSYVILAQDVNMPFSPQFHGVLRIPDEYFHKCKPSGRPGLKQNMKTTSFWFFFSPGWVRFGPPSPDFLSSSLSASGKDP